MTADLLKNEFMPYPDYLLEAWKYGDYSMLTRSNASEYIKKILVHKAKIRPGKRFFGEAYIASRIDMKEGWYNSFKWLTANKWVTGKGLEPIFEKPFHAALMHHIGKELLYDLQAKSASFYNGYKEKNLEGQQHKKPVAPDLWVIDENGRFIFIESKLPGDSINSHQIAGLALIKKHLEVRTQVSVAIINLYPGNLDPENLFTEFYSLA
jgi:hypothetical protein